MPHIRCRKVEAPPLRPHPPHIYRLTRTDIGISRIEFIRPAFKSGFPGGNVGLFLLVTAASFSYSEPEKESGVAALSVGHLIPPPIRFMFYQDYCRRQSPRSRTGQDRAGCRMKGCWRQKAASIQSNEPQGRQTSSGSSEMSQKAE